MNKLTTIMALALIALPLTSIAELKKNVVEIPRMATELCQYHPDKVACYNYVMSTVQMTMSLGVVGGICTAMSSPDYMASKDTCDAAKENIEFVKGVR